MMNMTDIGRRIADLRKQRDMTQLELAEKLGVSYQAVSSWERGLTMPDISKLPDISQVLQVSIDHLLGDDANAALIKNVLTQPAEAVAITPEELAEIAPAIKPSQVESLMENLRPMHFSEVVLFAPFVSSEVLQRLVEKLDATLGENRLHLHDIASIAPFLDSAYVSKLALRIESVKGICAIADLAPFISQEVLEQLANKAEEVGGIHDLAPLAPFLRTEYLDNLAVKLESAGSICDLQNIAPFISQPVLQDLTIKAINAGHTKDIAHLLPFLGSGFLDELLTKAQLKD